MPSSDTIVVLDMDGVLLDLHVDVESLRGRIRCDFAETGVDRTFKPLLSSIEEAIEELEGRDPKEAKRLKKAAWDHIDRAEKEAARSARPRPGVSEFISGIKHLPLFLYTNNNEEAAKAAMEAAGIDLNAFVGVFGRKSDESLKPSGAPIVKAVKSAGSNKIRRVFMVGDSRYDMEAAGNARRELKSESSEYRCEIIAIGMRKDAEREAELGTAGADFLAATLDEAAGLILARPIAESLSIVLLAYNEEKAIAKAIDDSRRFCRLYVPDYEIVVVDDGSADGTSAVVEKSSQGDVRLIKHATNMGMGSAMKDGYRAASKSYVVHLPGDRQVRAQSLAPFFEHMGPMSVPLSFYVTPPSGRARRIMSVVFRRLVSGLGGLSVDFAGTYVFNKELFDRVDPPGWVASRTFLYSFQLLERMKRAGCSFRQVSVNPFPRIGGKSREATVERIAKMALEILRHRVTSGIYDRLS